MAKMYPEVFPGARNIDNPEYIAYESLRQLPDSYVVLYSKRIQGGLFGKPECEIDFIISNQRDVLVCLEVKGGILEYDGAQDRWKQNNKWMDKSPDRQAISAMHALLHELSKELCHVNVAWALCFPQCCVVKTTSPIGVPLSRILDESRLAMITKEYPKLESEIREAFRKPGMSPKEAHDLIERLTRGIGFVQTLGVRIAREAKQLIQVTEEQCEALADLEINARMIVHGAAGTGKTVLAQELAKRLVAKRRSVLLLFYNRGIAAKVRHAFTRDQSILVTTFSSFAKRLVENNDGQWFDPSTTKDSEFWNLILPARLFEIRRDNLPNYDVIIVDEGQDFKPEWYEFLLTLLKSNNESQFIVFLDEHQDIFGHWKRFPCLAAPAKKVLTKNCRNTKAIVEYLENVYPTHMKSYDNSPSGVAVIKRIVRNDIEEQTQLIRDIKHLIGNDKVAPGSIVVLLNCQKNESSIARTESIFGFPLVSTYDGYYPKERKIYYSSIEIFKGLEADIIFIICGGKNAAIPDNKRLYVQGSRAKHVLYIYQRAARDSEVPL